MKRHTRNKKTKRPGHTHSFARSFHLSLFLVCLQQPPPMDSGDNFYTSCLSVICYHMIYILETQRLFPVTPPCGLVSVRGRINKKGPKTSLSLIKPSTPSKHHHRRTKHPYLPFHPFMMLQTEGVDRSFTRGRDRLQYVLTPYLYVAPSEPIIIIPPRCRPL